MNVDSFAGIHRNTIHRILCANAKHFYLAPCSFFRYLFCRFIHIWIVVMTLFTNFLTGIDCGAVCYLKVASISLSYRCRSGHLHIEFKRLILNMGIPVITFLRDRNIIVKCFGIFFIKLPSRFILCGKAQIDAMVFFLQKNNSLICILIDVFSIAGCPFVI